MASKQEFMDYVVDQMAGAGEIFARKMFGEYGVYFEGKFFAVVCDDMLYIKPTEEGRKFIGNVHEAPPYPGAKNYFLIEDKLDDNDWLAELVKITAAALPEPKPKKTRKKKK